MVTRATSYGSGLVVLIALIAFAANAVVLAGNFIVAAHDTETKVSFLLFHTIVAGAIILFFWMAGEGDFKWFRRISKAIWRKMRATFSVELPDNIEDHDPLQRAGRWPPDAA